MVNFIETYDNALSKHECESIIDFFENNKNLQTNGRSGQDGRVDKTVKDSTDIPLFLFDKTIPSNLIGNILNDYTIKYREKYQEIDKICLWSVDARYNLQRYYPGQGYHHNHCEHTVPGCYRILAWMIYLNDISDNGQTRFDRYDLNIKPSQGKLCMWPAYWTHTHRGIPSNSQTKYIATGWHTFVPLEKYELFDK